VALGWGDGVTLEEALRENAELRRLLAQAGLGDALASSGVLDDPTLADLQRRAALQRAILESASDYAIISLDLQGRITSWNAGAVNVLGWSEAEMLGRPLADLFTETEVAADLPARKMRQAAEAGREEDERFHHRRDGSLFWANAVMMPLRDETGRQVGYVKVLRDRSHKHQAQLALEESEARLRFERATLEAIFQAAPVGLSISEAPSGRSLVVNAATRRMLGRDYGGDDLVRYEDGGGRRADGSAYAIEDYPSVRALRHGEEVRAEPLIVERPDGGRVRLEASSTPVRGADGAVIAAVTVLVDVEAREQAIEHQSLLMAELAHRMKNTLAMVQAIVSQTLRSADTLKDARLEVMERLAALSRAQDALTRTSWVSATLADTVEAALAPLALGPGQLQVEGPEVRLGARAALSFTLVLHELATNASKYGALSTSSGRVTLGWALEPCGEDERLVLTWSESEGPQVRPPSRTGFGSRLIDSVSRTFAGESTLSYEPHGLRCRVTASAGALRTF
jgi:PAS domain S-box-containing protein